ncbi:MAG: CHAD domain-containing protein [Bacteroidales bacterium]|nr:CHAD domain-containing protein [Bacteroidales bacterium]
MEPDYVKLREIKPVLAGYIREAQGLLMQSPMPDDRAVHDVRVLMKKCRAVMRLISSQVDEKTYGRDYEAYRETGRLLCSWRETSVHRKTLKELKKNHARLFSSLHGNEKLEALMKKIEIPAEPSAQVKGDLVKIEELLNKAGFRLRFLKLDNIDPKRLLAELENTYNIVIDKYMICRNSPKPANLHMFRKKAKDFLYQLWFFRPLNPGVIKSLEKKLDAMTQNLGKNNDLSQLVAKAGKCTWLQNTYNLN